MMDYGVQGMRAACSSLEAGAALVHSQNQRTRVRCFFSPMSPGLLLYLKSLSSLCCETNHVPVDFQRALARCAE